MYALVDKKNNQISYYGFKELLKSPENEISYAFLNSDRTVPYYNENEFKELVINGRYHGYETLGLTDLTDDWFGLAPFEFLDYRLRPHVRLHEKWHHWLPPEQRHNETLVDYKASQSVLSRN